eukprot:scaffold333_cov133-Cylindrotheca_fusiformis.AAC.22
MQMGHGCHPAGLVPGRQVINGLQLGPVPLCGGRDYFSQTRGHWLRDGSCSPVNFCTLGEPGRDPNKSEFESEQLIRCSLSTKRKSSRSYSASHSCFLSFRCWRLFEAAFYSAVRRHQGTRGYVVEKRFAIVDMGGTYELLLTTVQNHVQLPSTTTRARGLPHMTKKDLKRPVT